MALAQEPVEEKLADIGPIDLRVVIDKEGAAIFNEYVRFYHYLGYKKALWMDLRYFIEGPGSILGCILFSGAAKALK